MATEVKRLIRVRVEKGASFKRDGFGKKRQLSDSWRKPRGQHNKQREQKKAKGALPKPGFGSPVAVRGMHPSGFFEALVSTIKELEGLDPKTHAVRIAATVGDRKRVALQEAAIAAGLKVLNARTVKSKVAKKAPAKAEAKDEGKQKKEEKKPTKSKATATPAKKEAKKEKPAPKTEEKKALAKRTAKPKAESAEKAAEKPAKKAKAPAKSTKAPAKPKAEKSTESAEAKSKATAKPKTKKTTAKGVKKNE
jgi:large subunit ribosomal protein L32e